MLNAILDPKDCIQISDGSEVQSGTELYLTGQSLTTILALLCGKELTSKSEPPLKLFLVGPTYAPSWLDSLKKAPIQKEQVTLVHLCKEPAAAIFDQVKCVQKVRAVAIFVTFLCICH